jgi:ComF family protein
LLHAFKYEAALYLASFLTQLMLEAKDEDDATECLIPIPLHGTRLQKRGFNQAAILAQNLSTLIQKPCLLQGCTKILPTLAQAGLDAKQRRTNLLHAFQAGALPYQHITLIDDLFTTGATANAVAKTLKQAGVRRVDLWCCARAC